MFFCIKKKFFYGQWVVWYHAKGKGVNTAYASYLSQVIDIHLDNVQARRRVHCHPRRRRNAMHHATKRLYIRIVSIMQSERERERDGMTKEKRGEVLWIDIVDQGDSRITGNRLLIYIISIMRTHSFVRNLRLPMKSRRKKISWIMQRKCWNISWTRSAVGKSCCTSTTHFPHSARERFAAPTGDRAWKCTWVCMYVRLCLWHYPAVRAKFVEAWSWAILSRADEAILSAGDRR